MPQTDTPPDFAALWAEYRRARWALDDATRNRKPATRLAIYRVDENFAARALLDALTGDAELQRLEREYWAVDYDEDPPLQEEYCAAVCVLNRLTIMGLLHGPEKETYGPGVQRAVRQVLDTYQAGFERLKELGD